MRILTAVVALVVGFVIGWLVRPPSKVHIEALAGDPLVIVHPDGTLSRPELRIDRTQVVGWATEGGQSLDIVFPSSGFPAGVSTPPFVDMKPKGTNWLLARCGSAFGLCLSGKVNDLPKGELRYRYDQVVGATRVDGMIIINP